MEYYREVYELEIVHQNDEEGLIRPGMVHTKATGIRSLDHVQEIKYLFQDMARGMSGSKVNVGRKITFYCSTCSAMIGDKTIPLRLEQMGHMRKTSVETSLEISTEMHKCLGCGHHTRYSIPDPILTVY
jgi:hypothetical protein